MFLPSSLSCFTVSSAFSSLHTQTVTLYPLSCAQDFTHTRMHTSHPVCAQSLPAAIVTEPPVLLSMWAATVTAAVRGGMHVHSWMYVDPTWSSARVTGIGLDLRHFRLEWSEHDGDVRWGLVKSSAQEGLDSAGGSSGRWSHQRRLLLIGRDDSSGSVVGISL